MLYPEPLPSSKQTEPCEEGISSAEVQRPLEEVAFSPSHRQWDLWSDPPHHPQPVNLRAPVSWPVRYGPFSLSQDPLSLARFSLLPEIFGLQGDLTLTLAW